MLKILIVMALSLICAMTVAADDTIDGNTLFLRMSGISVKEMEYLADSALKSGDEKRAVSIYMYLCDKAADDGSAEVMKVRIRAYIAMGDILGARGNYSGALEMYVKGLRICESMESKPYAAEIYKDIGTIYSRIYDYERGSHYYRIGLGFCKSQPDKDMERKLLLNLGGIDIFMGKIEEAEACHRRARRLLDESDSTGVFMDGYLGALILSANGRHREAASQLRGIASYADSIGLAPTYRCSAWTGLYKAYDAMEMPDSALLYMERCRKFVTERKIGHLFPKLLLDMSEFYKKHHDSEKSRYFKTLYLDMRDSVHNMRQFDIAKNMQFLYETEKVTGEIKGLERERLRHEGIIHRQRMELLGVAGGLLVVSIFLFIILRQKRKIQAGYMNLYRLNRNLEQRQEEMRSLRNADAEAMKAKDMEIASLQERLGNSGGSGAAVEKPAQQPETAKYSSSNLDRETGMRLRQEIAGIMENTEEFCNPDFSLETLAERVSSNSKYVSQVINDSYGKNFSAYVNEYRVRLAAKRLADPEFRSLTIKAVSESVGFKTHATFITVFRKVTGMTPSVYQKMAAKDAGK